MSMSCSYGTATTIALFHTTLSYVHFRPFKSNEDIFNETQKLWFSYIKRFLEISLQGNVDTRTTNDVIWSHTFLFSLCGTFLNISNLPSYSYIYDFVPIKKPQGHLHYSYIVSDFNFIYAHHPWVFAITSILKLNLSFGSIYFSSRQKYCFHGHICIHNNEKVREYITTQQTINLWQNSHSFCYCGQHASFHLYPWFTTVFISICKMRHILFHFDASFSVMDTNSVENVLVRSAGNDVAPDNTFRFPGGDLIMTFHIKVGKIAHVLLHIVHQEPIKGVVVDEPLSSSRVVSINSSHLKTSSFECTIKILIGAPEKHVNDMNYFQYQSEISKTSEELYLNNNPRHLSLFLPNSKCSATFCLYLLKADENSHINITLRILLWDGTPSVDCKYGGFVTAELLPDEYTESKVLCESYDSSKKQAVNFFSLRTSIFMVLYWSNKQAQISSHFVVQLTECEAVKVDVCSMHYYCQNGKHDCSLYLNQAFRDSKNVQIVSITYTPKGRRPFVQLRHGGSSCTIVHTVYGEFGSTKDRWIELDQMCMAGFQSLPKITQYSNRKTSMKYEIKATFTKTHHMLSDSVSIAGPMTYCIFLPNSSSCKAKNTGAALQLENHRKGQADITAEVSSDITLSVQIGALSPSEINVDIIMHNQTKVVTDHTTNPFHSKPVGNSSGSPQHSLSHYFVEDLVQLGIGAAAFQKGGDTVSLAVRVTSTFGPKGDRKFHGWHKEIFGALDLTCYLKFNRDKNYRAILTPGDRDRFSISHGFFQGAQTHIQKSFYSPKDIYKELAKLASLAPESCMMPSVTLQYNLCCKFTYNTHRNLTYFIVSNTENKLVSWLQASKLCKHFETDLPYFSGKEEVEELHIFIRLSAYLPPVEALYLGLNYKKHVGVSFINIYTWFFHLFHLLHNAELTIFSLSSHLFQKWEKQQPVSFTLFSNTNYRMTQNVYECAYKSTLFFHSVHTLQTNCINYSPFRAGGKQHIHPVMSKPHMCTLMWLTNLAEPDWMSVHCHNEVMQYVLCRSRDARKLNDATNIENMEASQVCRPVHVKLNKECLFFVWFNGKRWRDTTGQKGFKHECKIRHASLFAPTQRRTIRYLFHVVSEAILLPFTSNPNLTARVTYVRQFNSDTYKYVTMRQEDAQGFITCTSPQKLSSKKGNTFGCLEGGYISVLNVCDGRTDYPNDNSDEEWCNCSHSKPQMRHRFLCKTEMLATGKITCSTFYYMTTNNSCVKYASKELKGRTNQLSPQEPNTSIISSNHSFYCLDGKVIDMALKDDLVSDWGPHTEDEPILLEYLKNDISVSCLQPDDLPCFPGHCKCYKIHDTCNYKLDKNNNVYPCRNGAHLHLCKSFECNLKYKCSFSYCIPWNFVCNGHWDCPSGEDEYFSGICGQGQKCVNMYKCSESHLCIHLDEVCDSKTDCGMQDDEMACHLSKKLCPKKCHCILYAVLCENMTVQITHHFFHFSMISLQHAEIELFMNVRELKVFLLRLNYNALEKICGPEYPQIILLFDLQHNHIQTLATCCFSSLSNVSSLLLAQNYISHFCSNSFFGLVSLQVLDLSHNPIFHLQNSVMRGTLSLKLLIIMNVSLAGVDTNALETDSDVVIKTTDFHLCCISPSHKTCTAVIPWHVSCANVFPKAPMRVAFVFISLALLLPCLESMWLHTNENKINAFGVLVISDSLHGFAFSLYFGIIWGTDLYFYGNFLPAEQIWKSGVLCFAAFQIFLCCCLLDQLIVVLMSFSRLRVVIHPMDTKFKQVHFTMKICAFVYIFAVIASAMTTILFASQERSVPISLCLPFVEPSNSKTFVKVILCVTVVSQTLVSTAVLVLHVSLVHHLLISHNSVKVPPQSPMSQFSFNLLF